MEEEIVVKNDDQTGSEDLGAKTSHVPLIGMSQASVNPSGNTFVVNFDNSPYESGEEVEEHHVIYLIQVELVSKTFGRGLFSKNVLNCVTLNVLPGRIYIIYGAKDSGKSTLLKTLLGLSLPTLGQVRYNLEVIKQSKKHAKIRYMPESDGMYPDCTVYENIMFFGRLNNFSRLQIDKLFNEVINRLYVSSMEMKVHSMDRMQKKRLSFFISCMSRPNILIMDEPTSGIDPIVKHELWTQMRFMQRNWGTTILLSTSDSEECLRADFVSYLRHGRIVETERPTAILAKWHVESLEQAFYCLAVKSGDQPDTVCAYHEEPFQENSWIQRKRMFNDFQRNFPCPTRCPTSQGVLMHERILSLWRNKLMFLFLGIVIPTIILLCFYYSIGQEVHQTKIGVLYCDACNDSTIVNDRLELYCSTVRLIQERFPSTDFYHNHERLEEDMARGLLRTMISYKSDSSVCQTPSMYSSETMLEPVVTIDVSDTVISNHIKSLIGKVKQRTLRRFASTEDSPKIINRFKTVHLESNKIVLGILTLITFHLSAVLASYLMMSRQEIALTDRLLVLGVRHNQLQLVQWFVCLVLLAVMNLYLVLFVLHLINESMGLTLYLWILSMSLSIAGISLGMLLGMLIRKFVIVSFVLGTFGVIALIFSGTLWPLEGIPLGLDLISEVIPHTFVLKGYQGLIFKDFDVMNEFVLKGIWVPIVWAVVTYVIFLCNIVYKFIKV